MSRAEKLWHLRPSDPTATNRLAAAIRVSPVVAQLLLNRKLTETEPARRFLTAPLAGLHEPELLPGVAEAARRLLDAFALSHLFVDICGADTFGLQKPDPDFLRSTIRRAGGAPEQAVMVGDSISDVSMGRAAGVPVIAVDYGYTDMPAAELGADRVISCLADLPPAVFELLAVVKTGRTNAS